MAIRDDIIAIPDSKIRNAKVASDYLVFMDFADSPKRFWTGWGDLVSGGNTWQGVGDLISIGQIPASTGATAESLELTLESATSEMQTRVRASASMVHGREIKIFQQFFDVTPDDESVQPWSPLLPAYAVYTGFMDQLAYSAERGEDGEYSRKVTLSTYGLFTNRNAPANGRWTDADQQRRYAGDLGCSRMPLYAGYSPVWTV